MTRTRTDAWSDSWADSSESARRSVQVLCAIARSVLGGALGAGVPLDPCCEEALHVVERWCRGDASDADVRRAAREVTLRRVEFATACDGAGLWRRRVCDAVLRACDEAREALEGSARERVSQMSVA